MPQGAVHGLLLFTAYVAPIGRVIESFSIGYHQFADDTQLFVAEDTADSADLTCVPSCSQVLIVRVQVLVFQVQVQVPGVSVSLSTQHKSERLF